MNQKTSQLEFIQASAHWFELFDMQLASENEPVHSRPLKSAIRLIRYGIEEITGGVKENFFEENWFAFVVTATRKWYVDRYGTDSLKGSSDHLGGLAKFHGTPVGLRIPVTVSKVEIEGETSWMIFPDEVHESESIGSFFISKPNFGSLSDDGQIQFDGQVRDVVKWTRQIYLALQSASGLSEEGAQMAAGIWSHFEKAVTDILTLRPERAAVGCWELHLAIEKSLKVLLAQHGTPRTGHILQKLAQAAADQELLPVSALLDQLPPWELANKYRYAEVLISVHEAVSHYFTALQIAQEVTAKLKQDMKVNNAAFLLKKPKWIGPE